MDLKQLELWPGYLDWCDKKHALGQSTRVEVHTQGTVRIRVDLAPRDAKEGHVPSHVVVTPDGTYTTKVG